MSKAKKELADVVKPSLDFNDGKKHILQKIFEGDPAKLPVIKTMGLMPVPKDAASDQTRYISFTITSQGKEIIEIEVEEPTELAFAVDATKIAFETLILKLQEGAF